MTVHMGGHEYFGWPHTYLDEEDGTYVLEYSFDDSVMEEFVEVIRQRGNDGLIEEFCKRGKFRHFIPHVVKVNITAGEPITNGPDSYWTGRAETNLTPEKLVEILLNEKN